jgi:5-methyltetrahydropteroyltriglutamate--homocysteine methyltransferase
MISGQIFPKINAQRLLLEYDDRRSGSFAPLKDVPDGKFVVLGLISTKRALLESLDDLRGRINEASRYMPLEQLAISPQCGFASSIFGNPISPSTQRQKLKLLVDTARSVWG